MITKSPGNPCSEIRLNLGLDLFIGLPRDLIILQRLSEQVFAFVGFKVFLFLMSLRGVGLRQDGIGKAIRGEGESLQGLTRSRHGEYKYQCCLEGPR